MGVDVVVWPEEGPTHSVAMVEAELAYLDRDFSEGVFIRHPALFARDLADAVNTKVYQEWRWEAKVQELDRRAGLAGGVGGFTTDAHELSQGFHDYLLSGVLATEVYAIRLAVMVSALPVFLLAGLVAVVDGLGQRDLRRFGGGRERGQVYHLARGMVFPAFTAQRFCTCPGRPQCIPTISSCRSPWCSASPCGFPPPASRNIAEPTRRKFQRRRIKPAVRSNRLLARSKKSIVQYPATPAEDKKAPAEKQNATHEWHFHSWRAAKSPSLGAMAPLARSKFLLESSSSASNQQQNVSREELFAPRQQKKSPSRWDIGGEFGGQRLNFARWRVARRA